MGHLLVRSVAIVVFFAALLYENGFLAVVAVVAFMAALWHEAVVPEEKWNTKEGMKEGFVGGLFATFGYPIIMLVIGAVGAIILILLSFIGF